MGWAKTHQASLSPHFLVRSRLVALWLPIKTEEGSRERERIRRPPPRPPSAHRALVCRLLCTLVVQRSASAPPPSTPRSLGIPLPYDPPPVHLKQIWAGGCTLRKVPSCGLAASSGTLVIHAAAALPKRPPGGGRGVAVCRARACPTRGRF